MRGGGGGNIAVPFAQNESARLQGRSWNSDAKEENPSAKTRNQINTNLYLLLADNCCNGT
jgi:hypothetical protein